MRRSNARHAAAAAAEAIDRPEEKNKMDNSIKLQFRPNQSLRSTNLFSRNPKQHRLTKLSILVIGFVALVFASCSYFYLRSRDSVPKQYRIVIDGGSTGSRIHVFEYVVKDGTPVFDFSSKNGADSMRVNPGLSAFAGDPEGAKGSVLELMEFARKRIPEEEWGKTEVRLMATAGLRILDLGVQERILEACRTVLRGSGFVFRDDWASVISGSDEGVYAWIVANYALGTLGGDPRETTGIIELGGASAQVTFFSSELIPPEFSRTVKFGNISYSLYSHSLLHFGQNIAFDSIRESIVEKGQNLVDAATDSFDGKKPVDPCSPKGYKHKLTTDKLTPTSLAEQLSVLHSSGNFSECRSASLALLQKGKEKCAYEKCDIGSTFIPKLQGKFLATENFFHTSKFFGLSPRTFLSELMVAGPHFCEEDWSKLRTKYPTLAEEDLHRYCFSSAYIVALLHDSLGVALDDDRIGYANQVNNVPLDWALGAFILQSLGGDRSHPITSVFSKDSSTLLGGAAFSRGANGPSMLLSVAFTALVSLVNRKAAVGKSDDTVFGYEDGLLSVGEVVFEPLY